MDSETADIVDGAAETGPDGYEVAAGAELGQLLADSIARTGPLDSDAVSFDSLLDVDYDDCAIGACAPTGAPAKGKRPEMTFWEARHLIAEAGGHGVPLKVTARTCTLVDRALKAAQTHSARTQHVMLASYHYDTLPGPIGSTEIVVVDAEHVDQVNVRHDALTGWTFIAPEPTVTADVATIRAHIDSVFRIDGDENLPSDTTSTGDTIEGDLARNAPDADARVLRVLAAHTLWQQLVDRYNTPDQPEPWRIEIENWQYEPDWYDLPGNGELFWLREAARSITHNVRSIINTVNPHAAAPTRHAGSALADARRAAAKLVTLLAALDTREITQIRYVDAIPADVNSVHTARTGHQPHYFNRRWPHSPTSGWHCMALEQTYDSDEALLAAYPDGLYERPRSELVLPSIEEDEQP